MLPDRDQTFYDRQMLYSSGTEKDLKDLTLGN
jgi:hypothetical protein